MKRKTLTITASIYEMLKQINKEDRYQIWDIILDNMFDGKQPKFDDNLQSDSIKNAFICLSYELGKIQKQYENGCQKKLSNKTKGILCPNESTHNKPIQSTINQAEPGENYIYNNIINNNNNNIYNTDKQTYTNNKEQQIKVRDSSLFALAGENFEQQQAYYEILLDKAKFLEELEPGLYNRFLNLITRIVSEKEPLKVQGYYTAPEIILQQYINIFRCYEEEAMQRLITIFENIDQVLSSKSDITNDYKYIVAYIYNKACNF